MDQEWIMWIWYQLKVKGCGKCIHVTVCWCGRYVKCCITHSLLSKHISTTSCRCEGLGTFVKDQINPVERICWIIDLTNPVEKGGTGCCTQSPEGKKSHAIYFLFLIEMLMFMQKAFFSNCVLVRLESNQGAFRLMWHSRRILAKNMIQNCFCDTFCGHFSGNHLYLMVFRSLTTFKITGVTL